MTEHKPSVVLRWPKPAQIAYLTGLHEALHALRPVVIAAVEWSIAPDDLKVRDALLEAVREYRGDKQKEQG